MGFITQSPTATLHMAALQSSIQCSDLLVPIPPHTTIGEPCATISSHSCSQAPASVGRHLCLTFLALDLTWLRVSSPNGGGGADRHASAHQSACIQWATLPLPHPTTHACCNDSIHIEHLYTHRVASDSFRLPTLVPSRDMH